MADGRINTWESLACLGCGNLEFIATMFLRTKVGGGTSPAQGGWQCASCGQKVDMGEMQRVAFLQAKQAELEALTLELSGAKNAATPATRKAASSSLSSNT